MDVVDRKILLNKLKQISIQNNIINNLKKDLSSLNDSNIEQVVQTNVQQIPSIKQVQTNAELVYQDNLNIKNLKNIKENSDKIVIPEVFQKLIDSNIIISQISPIVSLCNTLDISNTADSSNVINEIEENITKEKILNIIESLKEPISLLEKYILTKPFSIDIDETELKKYINIYKSIVSIKELPSINELNDITVNIKKTGCFSAIKKFFSKK